MGIRNVLSKVMDGYLSTEDFKKVDYDMRVKYKEEISASLPSAYEQRKVKGSAGSGGKAQVPWFCIFDERVTNKASKGYYLVYLFKTDMSGVYLSLNQAWQPFSKQGVIGRENIRRVSERIWDTLKRRRDVPVGLRTSIDLACSGHNDDLARGYEQGHICGLYYAAGSLPGEDQLEKDLECMLKVYASLVDMFIGENNANPFDQYQALIPEVCETSDSVSSILHDFSELVPVDEFREVPFPGSAPRAPSARPRRSAPYKPDYELMQKQRKRSGEKGEQMAMRLLKHLYPSCEILHVSATDDGAGFDIRVSGSAVGEELHVEVKATEKKSEHTSFHISANELRHAREDGEQFMLLRLFDIDGRHPGYYKITGAEVQHLVLTPNSYNAEIS